MNATVQDEHGQQQTLIMGCYGLGVSRTMAAAIEAHHDDNGIVWPINIAPYEAVVIVTNMKDESITATAAELYSSLKAAGVDVLIDDRDERAGIKFKDMDLIGIPVQIVVGKALAEGFVEVSLRRAKSEKLRFPVAEACSMVADMVRSEKARF